MQHAGPEAAAIAAFGRPTRSNHVAGAAAIAAPVTTAPKMPTVYGINVNLAEEGAQIEMIHLDDTVQEIGFLKDPSLINLRAMLAKVRNVRPKQITLLVLDDNNIVSLMTPQTKDADGNILVLEGLNHEKIVTRDLPRLLMETVEKAKANNLQCSSRTLLDPD